MGLGVLLAASAFVGAIFAIRKALEDRPVRPRLPVLPPPPTAPAPIHASPLNTLIDYDIEYLDQLGYAMDSIFSFQQDFNLVNAVLLEVHQKPMMEVSLQEDGVIGNLTRTALAWAVGYSKSLPWPDIVSRASKYAGG